jgi:hypothetical protein
MMIVLLETPPPTPLHAQAKDPDENVFLTYVAATRAEKALLLNPDMLWVKDPNITQVPCPYLTVSRSYLINLYTSSINICIPRQYIYAYLINICIYMHICA